MSGNGFLKHCWTGMLSPMTIIFKSAISAGVMFIKIIGNKSSSILAAKTKPLASFNGTEARCNFDIHLNILA